MIGGRALRSAVSLSSYRELLSRYLRPQSGTVAWMGCFLLAATGLQVTGPLIAGRFIDAAQSGAADPILLQTAGLFLIVTLLSEGLSLLASVFSERVAWQATNGLRLDVTAHLLRLGPGFHSRHRPGELIERVDGDVTHLSTLLSAVAIDLLGSALLLLGLIAALFSLDGWLGLSFGGFVIVTAVLLEGIRRRSIPLQEQSREHSAMLFGFLGEALSATEDVRASGGGPYVLRRLRTLRSNWLPVYARAEIGAYGVWIAALAASGVGDGIAYGFSAGLYLGHALTLGQVYAVVAYAALVARPLGTIRQRLAELQGADAAILRVRELLAAKPTVVDGTARLPQGPPRIEFRGVRFAYQDSEGDDGEDRYALENVSFRLEPERRLGVIGRTGSGKTTIARLLVRLYDPQEGCIEAGGADLRALSIADLRSRVRFVPQDVQIFAANLRDNITLFDAGADDAILLDILESLGLGPWLEQLPEGLDTQIGPESMSAGQAQLIAFARAFGPAPGVVILDEASSRMDPATESLLGEAVDRLLWQRTGIVIAHRPATLERMDDILVLERGRVLEFGAREQLARDPHSLYSAFRRQGFREVLD